MSACKKDQDIGEWLLMNIPDDPESEDEYNVDDTDDTDVIPMSKPNKR